VCLPEGTQCHDRHGAAVWSLGGASPCSELPYLYTPPPPPEDALEYYAQLYACLLKLSVCFRHSTMPPQNTRSSNSNAITDKCNGKVALCTP
jgi:hypothetical protein